MKKITSIVLLLATVFLVIAMTGCKKNKDGVPDGMQLVYGGENDAFSFFAPEEWIVANYRDIACAYASKVDTTSMTFTEITIPDGKIREYFESERPKFPYTIEIVENGVDCNFGNASGIKYVYTYNYKEVSYTCMQIFTMNNGRYYLFTYTANNTQRDAENTYYEYYLEKVTASIDAFTFHANYPRPNNEPSYEKDSDGYMLVSDKKLSGFKMYVPESYKVDYSSAFVSVSKQGINITMTETTYPANTQSEYWEKRRSDIEAFADKIPATNTEGNVSSFAEIKAPEKVDSGNADAAVAYEYSYRLDGIEYRVYQLLLRKGKLGGKVYVYTYTATTDCYDAGLEEAKAIFGKIEF